MVLDLKRDILLSGMSITYVKSLNTVRPTEEHFMVLKLFWIQFKLWLRKACLLCIMLHVIKLLAHVYYPLVRLQLHGIQDERPIH